MKNSKKILACTLGLMLGVGVLVGCGGNNNEGTTNSGSSDTYTVEFYNGNELLKTETVNAGEKCPEYIPEEKTDYTFMGWYSSRSVRDDTTKFSFDTLINEDLKLYAWYKQNFAASTDVFYIVGAFEGAAWDGDASAAVPTDRTLTHTADSENEKNIYEYTIDAIYRDEKFRLIKSTDGLVSDGWTDSYGFDIVSKVIGADGTELDKATAITEQDSKNIGVLFNAKLKVTYTMESDYSPNGEIVLTILENLSPKTINKISVMGGTGETWLDTYYLTSEDKVTWTYENAELAENFTWKLRADEDWKASWGYSAIESAPEGAFEEGQNDGNIVTKVGGTYNISFNYETGKITITTTTPNPDPKPSEHNTVAEALAAEDGTDVVLVGVVDAITYAYDEKYNNISIDLKDETGTINIFRMEGKVNRGDKIKVTGTVASYDNKKQIAAGSTFELLEAAIVSTYDAEITFDDKNNLKSFSTEQQVWSADGITVTNDKANSASDVADYFNPARFYKNSKLTIEYTETFSEMIIECAGGAKYYFAAEQDITGGTLAVDGSLATITMNENTKVITIDDLNNQVRIAKISIIK